jgi:hypothetical protein
MRAMEGGACSLSVLQGVHVFPEKTDTWQHLENKDKQASGMQREGLVDKDCID